MLSPSKGTTASSSLATCKLYFNNNIKPAGRSVGPESTGAASRPVKSFKSGHLDHDSVNKAPNLAGKALPAQFISNNICVSRIILFRGGEPLLGLFMKRFRKSVSSLIGRVQDFGSCW